ncbi:MAG: TIGR01212 family radical SAM protein [Clostridia bacterium]|nr:TIGR01212 family radical SAM protein [Clostridia bacterium]
MPSSKPKQRDINPFPHSDSNKRYYTFDYYLKKKYGEKCAKITLDAGFTCPNIDGQKSRGGCIYCSARGSGDFAQSAYLSLREQYDIQVKKIRQKWNVTRFLPYLQAHTNTYASLDTLQAVYSAALALPGSVGLHIATRADCLPGATVEYIAELAEKTDVTVELGLQSAKDETARLINRAHSYEDFLEGYYALRNASSRIRVAVHLINGLPGETEEDMLNTVKEIAKIHPNECKIHLLHVLKGTVLAEWYKAERYIPMEQEAYVRTVVKQLTLLPEDIVIGRLTGDGSEADLLAPLWSKKKTIVLNEIDKMLYCQNLWQGKCAK